VVSSFYRCFRVHGNRKREKIGSQAEGVSEKMAHDIRMKRIVTGRLSEDLPKKNKITLKEAFEKYNNSCKTRTKSWKNDLLLYNKRIENKFGKKQISKITPYDLELFMQSLFSEKLSSQTVKHHLALIKRVYNYVIKHELYSGNNPVSKIEMPKINNIVTEILTNEQSQKLLKELDEYPNKSTANLIKFAYYTGLRKGEILKLQWKDVNLVEEAALLRDTKSGKDETVALSKNAIKVLNEQLELNLKSLYVFPGKDGEQRKEFRKSWQTILKRAGIQNFRFHGLRHNFASQLAKNPEISSNALQTIMRHKDFKTTQRYITIEKKDIKNAVNKF